MNTTLIHGDCLEKLKTIPESSVDSIVTDPPYGLNFMGKKWDYDVPSEAIWRECLRVLKPGGHLLSFAGTRTQHRMAVRIEDAGFEIRDMIAWVYGSGFPKSLDVSKAIDKAAGAEREVKKRHVQSATRPDEHAGASAHITMPNSWDITAPATPEAQQWQGWGTALKPALEPITVARKPLVGTVATNVLAHGTGALNVDGCRVAAEAGRPLVVSDRRNGNGVYRDGLQGSRSVLGGTDAGRWPANLIHDGSDEVVALFPVTTSGKPCGKRNATTGFSTGITPGATDLTGFGDTGSAARFFYCAKSSKKDRGEGNTHPTVKPTDMMRYLCRLVTPPGGTVLDPFMGSGSTGKAAILEKFNFIGIELDKGYFDIASKRIAETIGNDNCT